jgi:hypothetical protein
VCDESSAIKNPKAEQTKAVIQLRRRCGRVLLLNGTPIANNPLDMYAQGLVMDPRILDCKSYFHFRAKYAVMGGFNQRQVIAWQNLEDMQRRFMPYVLRRLKTDCLDLPPKLAGDAVGTAHRQDVAHVSRHAGRDGGVALARQDQRRVAGGRQGHAPRTACGWVPRRHPAGGGRARRRDAGLGSRGRGRRPAVLHPAGARGTVSSTCRTCRSRRIPTDKAIVYLPPEEVGREKLDFFLDWIAQRLEDDPNLKLLAWCRFRPELARVVAGLAERFPQVHVGAIWGGQTQDRYRTIAGEQVLIKEGERGRALRLLDPRTTPKGPVIVVGTPSTGSMGLNLTAANVVVYMSNDFSLKTRLQSEDRVHRPGQTRGVSYFDLVATGPAGQKTVDHLVIKALREKEDVATWTTQAWRAQLMEE